MADGSIVRSGPFCRISGGILVAVLLFFGLEWLLFEISISHILGLSITIGCYVITVLLNSASSRPIAISDLFVKNLGKTISESLTVTLILLGMVSLVRWYYIQNHSDTGFFQLELLESSYFAYLWVAPLQELTLRGLWQSHLFQVLPRSYAKYGSILITCSVFFLLHLFYSVPLSLMALAFGILCGLMFHRHQNVIGVGFCHVVLGNFIGLVGFWDMLVNSRIALY